MSDNKNICGKSADCPDIACGFEWIVGCPHAPLLHALPSATDEQREAALFCLTGPLIPAMRLIVINRMSRVEEKGGSDENA